jgi:hypothetical protein
MAARLVLALAIVVGCKSKEPPQAPEPAVAPKPQPAPASGAGLSITDTLVPEFSGSYDKVLAQVRDDDHRTVIAFVRGCPALTCETGAWEPEQVAHVCPQAAIATVTVDGEAAGGFRVDLKLAGPAEHAATATIERVSVELTRVEHDGVDGSAHVDNSDAHVDGAFHAEVCPRT